MLGLVNQAIERFVRDTYGDRFWAAQMRPLAPAVTHFEALSSYDPDLTARLLDAVAGGLGKPVAELAEDIGTYLVSGPSMNRVRRLLRFGGTTFEEFVLSLDDLPARVRLAVPDLHLPQIEVLETGAPTYAIRVSGGTLEGVPFGRVLLGLLRAMADDYGALVLLEHREAADGAALLDVRLLKQDFSEGRSFALGALSG